MNAVAASQDSNIIISCLMSHPAKKVRFFKYSTGGPAKEIQITDSKYRLINDQELVIRRVSLVDFGIYVCRTENNYIEEKKIQLFINSCKFLRFI